MFPMRLKGMTRFTNDYLSHTFPFEEINTAILCNSFEALLSLDTGEVNS